MTVGAKQLTDRAIQTRTRTPPPFPAREVRALVDALGRLGYDTDALLAGARLSRSTLEDADALVPCETCGLLFCAAQQMRPMRNLMLRLAEQVSIGAFPLLDYLVVTSDSVGDALKQLARYFRLAGGSLLFDFQEDEDPIRVLMQSTAPGVVEFDLVLIARHLRAEADGEFSAAAAYFAQPLDDVNEYQRAMHCPVRAEATWSGLLLSREVWNLPMRRRDPILRGVLEHHANEMIASMPAAAMDAIAIDVRRALASRIAGGDTRIESVARQLAIAPRTLQRRLAAVGLSYQALVELTRREAAERHLAASTLSIAEIGYLLGYSEPTAFHRAFKRWTNLTPHAYRANARS